MFDVQPYNPIVKYVKGQTLYIADTLSRDCQNEETPDPEEFNVQIILSMSQQALEDFKKATAADKVLQTLIKVTLNG